MQSEQTRSQQESQFIPEKIDQWAFPEDARLNRVNLYLRANISEPFSLSKAADLAGLERTYFSTYFHKQTRLRFGQWVGYVRVEEAKKYLRVPSGSDSATPVGDVCFAVGYRDLRTFQRSFRRHTGLSPSEFRRSAKTSSDAARD